MWSSSLDGALNHQAFAEYSDIVHMLFTMGLAEPSRQFLEQQRSVLGTCTEIHDMTDVLPGVRSLGSYITGIK